MKEVATTRKRNPKVGLKNFVSKTHRNFDGKVQRNFLDNGYSAELGSENSDRLGNGSSEMDSMVCQ